MNEAKLRSEICDIGRELARLGLIGGLEGNVSCRLDTGRILATPTGVAKSALEPGQITLITPEGAALCEGQVSSEIALHLRIYLERPDVAAVVHAHPPVATGFAVAGREIPARVMPEADLVLGPVALVPFAIPGTEAMGDAAAPFLADHNTLLLASHGAVASGYSLSEAFIRMETLERVAKVLLVAHLLGGAQQLPAEGVRWLDGF